MHYYSNKRGKRGKLDGLYKYTQEGWRVHAIDVCVCLRWITTVSTHLGHTASVVFVSSWVGDSDMAVALDRSATEEGEREGLAHTTALCFW